MLCWSVAGYCHCQLMASGRDAAIAFGLLGNIFLTLRTLCEEERRKSEVLLRPAMT